MAPTFDNTYAALPDRFYSSVKPEPVSSPSTLVVNDELAQQLDFDPQWLASDEGAEFATGNRLIDGSEPIAMVYAGHQFGNWVPRLGDGRAHLLGEVLDDQGQRFDIQLKGSGPTPYSRRGDGRAPLGPVLREYLISEAMAALGVPTTRSLMAAATGEPVHRQTRQPGGVLVRVARSHIRIGTFQYFAAQQDRPAIELLIDYVIERHYPDLAGAGPLALLERVAEKQAQLVAQWQLLGFIHGVMNTDNMLLSGETIDYGPCAFMNDYDPATVYSSIDRHGRYAFGNQPFIAQWNLSQLASALLVATDDDDALTQAQEIVDSVRDKFRSAYGQGMANKLGFSDFSDDDWPLIENFLEQMYKAGADYTLTFRKLREYIYAADQASQNDSSKLPESMAPWLKDWQARLAKDDLSDDARRALMDDHNPRFIPRNHRVDTALNEAVDHGDFTAFHRLLNVIKSPYQEHPEHQELALPPAPDEEIAATFCGT